MLERITKTRNAGCRTAVVIGLVAALTSTGERALAHPSPPGGKLPATSPSQALAKLFPTSKRVTYQWVSLAKHTALERRLRTKLAQRRYAVYVATTGRRVDGYAFVSPANAFGSSARFAVKLTPNGSVADVRVIVLRDRTEAGVLQERFLRQFRGKTAKSRLRIDRDIRAPHHCGEACLAAARTTTLATQLVSQLVRAR